MARSDNDSWDLASSVGATATMVAASRALASRGPDPLIADPFAEPLVRAVGVEFFTRMVDGEIQLDETDPEFNQQRMAEGMAVRTRFFDSLFTSAASAGVRQAVILAAGLDARAYRLPWPSEMVVYEVDQPQVIEFKTTALAELGAEPSADRRPVGIDLREDWPTALQENGFDTSEPTAWIAEGLLVYLPPHAQDRLFDNITALSAPGSRLATEQVGDMKALTDGRSQRMAERLRQYGFDVQLSDLIFDGERSHVVEYLTGLGWRVSSRTTPELYAANGFAPPEDESAPPFAANINYVTAELTAQNR
jgi:methyltransferase (TIGR00027 family)